MTVKELILKLSEFDGELEVLIDGETTEWEVDSVVQVDPSNEPSEVILS